LLVELEEHIVEIDKDKLDMVNKDYREKMALFDIEEVIKNNRMLTMIKKYKLKAYKNYKEEKTVNKKEKLYSEIKHRGFGCKTITTR